MTQKTLDRHCQKVVVELFTAVFAASEGAHEGEQLGRLVAQLTADIDNQDIIGFGTYNSTSLIGAIFFTRLYFDAGINIFMLAPVAVDREYQRQGIGQELIQYGLKEMKARSTAIVTTYGDLSFYGKVGFESLSENKIKAPLTLSMPEGWLGQSLTAQSIPTLSEQPRCIDAFNNPVYW